MRATVRKIHRWIGLLMGLQIIAWMASGLYFSLFPIEEIRGEHLTRDPETLGSVPADSLGTPAQVREAIDRHLAAPWTLTGLKLVRRDGRIAWHVSGTGGSGEFERHVSADGQNVWPPISENDARRIAEGWLLTPSTATSVEWVTDVAPDSEIRGRRLPLWRVGFDQPEGLSLYIDPWTAELVARRTTRWRVFDFFWMLHTMDFESRDDFNHLLLQTAALLGLFVALSGVVFWAMTTRLFRRRRSR